MTTLKKQLDDIRHEAELEITNILKEFVSKTGYVPLSINVNVTDVSQFGDKEPKYIISKIDLAYGQ